MQPTRHVTFRLLATGTLLALLVACQTTATGPGPASVARAERLARQGNHAEAARMYEDLAGSNVPPERDQLAIAATRAWLDANRADDAQRALGLAGAQLPSALQFERSLLQVEVGAARGQYQAAWQQAAQLPEPASPQDASRLFFLRQQVALRAGQTNEAIRAGIARERVAADDTARNRVRRDLLNDLRAAIDRGLRVEPTASRDPLERGWIEVAQIAARAGTSPLSASSMIQGWRQRFPGHPAATIVNSEILDPAARPDVAGRANAQVTGPVALLLPLSDRTWSGPASSVRDGFQAGAARLPDAALADVRIYDTGAMPVAAAIQRAVAEGASFIVGPLTREEVTSAAEQRPVHIPMLLLNTLPDSGGAWQYGLAPEDEARQIARQVAGSGRRNVVVLTPAGDWGQRVAAAFASELTQGGGKVIAEGVYDYGTTRNTIEPTITAALGIDAGRARHLRVQQATGTRLQFQVNPASGIDAIFAAGYAPEAMRQFRPFLQFYNAGDIPTFMTSDGVGTERAANRDLDGMRLLEMPWTLDTAGAAYDARLATESAWRSRGGPREWRLFAFGYDAAMLTAALRRGVVAWPLQGVTGRLSLTADGRIERQLNWARVRNGEVTPSDPQSP